MSWCLWKETNLDRYSEPVFQPFYLVPGKNSWLGLSLWFCTMDLVAGNLILINEVLVVVEDFASLENFQCNDLNSRRTQIQMDFVHQSSRRPRTRLPYSKGGTRYTVIVECTGEQIKKYASDQVFLRKCPAPQPNCAIRSHAFCSYYRYR
jgi:hypothetical protein